MQTDLPSEAGAAVPVTLRQPGALAFWAVVVASGLAAGLAGAALTLLLGAVQHALWPGPGTLVDAAGQAAPLRHVANLVAAGGLVALGQLLLTRLPSGNGIDITEAIWFHAGRLPFLKTMTSATLSIIIVGMGTSLGREGAPKQAGAALANVFCGWGRMSDEQRQLLVACGAGAGMAAAYGVPIGGALFALEVLHRALSLRLVLPAVTASILSVSMSWLFLPNAPTYDIPQFLSPPAMILGALVAGPIIGAVSVGFVRAVAWADRNKPKGTGRFVAPIVVLGLEGVVSIWYPQVLGNGKDAADLAFLNQLPLVTLAAVLLLKPLSTVMCLRSGAPGGLFTPSLALGSLLGATLGHMWSWLWPGGADGAFALVGATALLAATTQGPISAVVLVWELTGHDRALIIPMVLGVITATLAARTLEERSIYEARLSDKEVGERMELRDAV